MMLVQSQQDVQLPFSIETGGKNLGEFVAYYRENEREIEALLLEYGALKFKGVPLNSATDFTQVVDAIADQFMNYVDGNSPRTKLNAKVYTSTEYDPSQQITMHNELSYSAQWPGKLFFCCLQAAETGGETLLADSRKILKEMDPNIVDIVKVKGITYIRNLHGGEGFGPSWQDTFETQDPQVLENYCQSLGIDFSWTSKTSLRLIQKSPGIICHRGSGEEVWFNQIDQFHPLHLGEEMRLALEVMYGDPMHFPMYVSFGDGTAIDEVMVKDILDTIKDLTVAPTWAKQELLLVDNERTAHGRNAFTGSRKILVAMAK